jgi:hypothetical protein
MEERDRTRFLTINEAGKILSDSTDRSDAAPARSSDRDRDRRER